MQGWISVRTTKFDPRVLRHLVHPLALLPLALLIFDTAMGRLTANPIQDFTLRTGEPALILLILTLACTPLSLLFGWKWAIGWRRSLGLYSFLYVCLHLLVFVLLDYGVDLALITQAVAEKRYVLAGFAGFLLMLPLAVTSTKGWQRRLGRNWRVLHRLTYGAAILGVLHFLWLAKVPREPLIYAAILGALLLTRVPAIRRWISDRRRTLTTYRSQS
ncbi:MAG: sulfoxide reductase heme-binding subunit YedZ [Oscillochloris sp.]|nr:sulfoxide reductase heme-binding subunit YedZ [Oscillochloris sp.]